MKRSNHTPEGVRDIYNGACARKLNVCKTLNQKIATFGYQPIQTPTFEYFDVFSKEVGTTPSKNLYKFFDREGNTLVLRPDITPSIARSFAMYFNDTIEPQRLSYEGNVFINNSSYQGRLKESTQLGAELIGEPSVSGDAEILSMIVECLLDLGLKNFQISVGHAGIYTALVKAAEFDEDQVEELTDLISNKNFFGVEEFLEEHQVKEDLKKLFSMTFSMYSSADDWKDISKEASNYPEIAQAISHLDQLNHLLDIYGTSDYISYEPGLISNYEYYTGIIFSGYSYGSGEPLVRGGRYDHLLSYFGKDAAAIGFAFNVDQLMVAMERQEVGVAVKEAPFVITYNDSNETEMIQKAQLLRKEGTDVILQREK